MRRGRSSVPRPPETSNEYSQCSAWLSEGIRTSIFNENSDIQLFQQEISLLYPCLSLKKINREYGRFRYHLALLRFWYVCLNAPHRERQSRLGWWWRGCRGSRLSRTAEAGWGARTAPLVKGWGQESPHGTGHPGPLPPHRAGPPRGALRTRPARP